MLRSLRVRLILLVLLALLPSLALLYLTASQQLNDALDSTEDNARQYARLAAVDQERSSEQTGSVLTALSKYPELAGGDRQVCATFLQSLPQISDEPSAVDPNADLRIRNTRYRDLLLLNEDGTLACGVRQGEPISIREQGIVNRAFDTDQLALGNFRVDNESILLVTYAVPVQRTDGGQRVLLVTLEQDTLTAFAREVDLPDGSYIAIFDSDGTLEQQFPYQQQPAPGQSLVGTPVVDQILDADDEVAPDGGDGDFRYGIDQVFLDGVSSGSPRTFVLVGIPEAEIVDRAEAQFNSNLGKLGIAALVAVIAAWVGADLFVTRDAESRKGAVRRYYEAFDTGDTDFLDEVIGPGYVDRSPSPGQAKGAEGLRQNVSVFRSAFPDGTITPKELLADRDKVVARVTLNGTHTGDYFGIAPTGVSVTSDGVETFRFAHGLIAESWSLFGPLDQAKQRAGEAAPEETRKRGWFKRILRMK